ncbi:hypothetical protein E8E13_010149 [Curvularia kusanoi]|uniref:Uncharacterized protein n=1 Tax=Curvularia kusanoi TaxID=90978 RepID=A0A9P4TNM1_CURKU|nr:hypothetical protein E8E13_010149 [Curvularia kusanoi]
MPLTREAPESRTGPSLKAPSGPLGLMTVDLMWALDTPWHELVNGHQADPPGFPLGVLATVLCDEAAKVGIFLDPGFTLTDVLREVLAKEWRIFRPNMRFAKGVEGQIAEWHVMVRSRTINNFPVAIGLSVRRPWLSEQTSTREKSYVSIFFRLARSNRLSEDCTAIYRTWEGNMSSQPIFDAVLSDKDDSVKVTEVERILNEDAAAVLYLKHTSLEFPLEISASKGDLATTRLLLERGSPIRSLCGCTSVAWEIWHGFASRWSQRYQPMLFEKDFARCIDMTSLTIKRGAQIHEEIPYNEFEGNILWTVIRINALQPHQLGQVLEYLLSLGLSMEDRNEVGKTLLLHTVWGTCHHSVISAYLDAGADLYAQDEKGQGYLAIALGRMLEYGLDSKERSNLLLSLTVLLKADCEFSGRSLKPEETPWVSKLARSEEDWNFLMSIFKRLSWSTMEMETYRYRALLKYRGRILTNKDQKPRLLKQTRSRIGQIRAKEIDSSLAGETDSESDESEADTESDSSDEAEESDESGGPGGSEQFVTTASQ